MAQRDKSTIEKTVLPYSICCVAVILQVGLGLFGTFPWDMPRTCLDRRRHHRNIQQSELEMRRLKSLAPFLEALHMPSSHFKPSKQTGSSKMKHDHGSQMMASLHLVLLTSLQVRWSAERFADEDDPDASVKHMEMAWSWSPTALHLLVPTEQSPNRHLHVEYIRIHT